jgi:hypothetical protein
MVTGMRRLSVLVLAVAASCVGVMKPDPYAPANGVVVAGASGVPDVRCAGAPNAGPASGFSSLRQRIVTRFARPDHRGIDLIAVEGADQILRGKLAYGITDKPLGQAAVDLFACMAGRWHPIGTAHTRNDGRFAYALHGIDRLPVGLRDMYASARADRSGARFLAYVAPAGTPLVVSDVDGTLTSSESAFVKAVFLGANVRPHPGAAEALRQAAAAGAQIVYVTARGDRFTDETRHWLGTYGFPRGPMRLVPALFVKPGAATVAYKRSVLASLAGFSIAAGVGNRASDVNAYTAAGVPASKIFVKTPEYRGELSNALKSGAAVGFGVYGRIPLD